ncbi:hypothetical protein ACTXT7_010886 [Hymenolepis weldensis]
MESSMTNIVQARIVSEPSVPKYKSVPTSFLQIKYTASSRTHESFTKTNSPKCLGRYSRIRVISILICHPKRSALVDKSKQSEEISPAKLVSNPKGTASEVVAQNAGEAKQIAALISPQDLFMCSHTKALWSHTDLSLAGTIQGISYPGGFMFKVASGYTQ